ncbi:hypothetical protein ACA910_006601 [Epithemia clementina (nom. ined.)]
MDGLGFIWQVSRGRFTTKIIIRTPCKRNCVRLVAACIGQTAALAHAVKMCTMDYSYHGAQDFLASWTSGGGEGEQPRYLPHVGSFVFQNAGEGGRSHEHQELDQKEMSNGAGTL